MNKVILMGRVGDRPDRHNFPSGSAVTTFSLATSRRYTDRNGEKQEDTQWHRCEAWGKTGEIIDKYVKAGDQLCIEGELRYDKYEKEGVKRTSTKINVQQFHFGASGKKSSRTKSSEPAPSPAANNGLDAISTSSESEDDLPF